MVDKASNEIRKQVLDSIGGKPVDVNEMKSLLDLKVDKADFNKYNSIKANRNEFKGITSSIEIIQKQMKNMIIILLDYMDTWIPEKNITQITKAKQTKLNIDQMIAIYNWIKSFENQFDSTFAFKSTSDLMLDDSKEINSLSPYANSFINFTSTVKLRSFSPDVLANSKEIKRNRKFGMNRNHIYEDKNALNISTWTPTPSYVMKMK